MVSKRTKKAIAFFLAINLLGDAFFPTAALALTSGPSQPEVQSFTPVSTSDMVDVFSGDFNYNIPLLDVEGYPVNLSYDGGITMDQEASWTGLGWNINPGVINRNMRSLPDDFSGDQIKKEMHMRPNRTIGVAYKHNKKELFGKNLSSLFGGESSLSMSVGIKYNNYTGFATDLGANLEAKMHAADASGYEASLGLNSSSESGLGISPSVSYSRHVEKYDIENKITKISNRKHGIEAHLSSGQGLQSINYSYESDKKTYKVDDEGNVSVKSKSRKTGWAYSFASPTYTPYVGQEMTNFKISFDLALGGEVSGITLSEKLSAYYSTQFLKRRDGQRQTLDAYGYMNTDRIANKDAYDRQNILLDMNREKDGSFTKNTPNLHLTNFSYDIFAVKGQGIGGIYRPHRSDIGILFDARVYNRTESINAGVGFGYEFGNAAGLEFNAYGLGQSNSESGMWTRKDGKSEVALSFKTKSAEDTLYEPYYFALAGEKVAESDREFYDAIVMGTKPMRIALERRNVKFLIAKNEYYIEGVGNLPIPARNTRKHRAKRSELFSHLNAGEAAIVGVSKRLKSYRPNIKTMFTTPGSVTDIDSTVRYTKNTSSVNHHISEVSVVRSDGARYVYGTPIYNLSQNEVSFAVNTSDDFGNHNTINHKTGMVHYTPGTDNGGSNDKQIDNFYSRTITPPYAHSYLLTSVLSVDYVDVSGNGPSSDDMGNYTKFNYSMGKRGDGSTNFKWRIPFDKDSASVNEGMLSKKGKRGDDKANYTSGEKEIWNLHSIETKNYVAVFYTSNRRDGFGVRGENGEIDTLFPLHKLDSIELYTKKELETVSSPVPLKTVHFVYDYSLCHGTAAYPLPNNSGIPEPYSTSGDDNINLLKGKLTLKQVYFTYQGSFKGKLSPYKFTYDELFNYNYQPRAYERWGNYKPNLPSMVNGVNYSYTVAGVTTTGEDPYAVQNKTNADKYASAWALTKIELPSGGEINVKLEADDYAYVQNKRAMQMFRMHGFYNDDQLESSNLATTEGKDLFDPTETPDPMSKLFMAVEIDPVTAAAVTSGPGSDADKIRKAFFYNENGVFQTVRNNAGAGNDPSPTQLPIVYFRALVDLSRTDAIGYQIDSKYEYVSGYAELDLANDGNIGYKQGTDPGSVVHHYIFFKLKGVGIDDGIAGVTTNNNVNPISMAGMNFVKLYFPQVAYNNSQDVDDGIGMEDFVSSLVAAFNPIIDVFRGGITKSMWKTGCASQFIPDKSFVRLYSPLNKKLGGGYRVKELRLNDKWEQLSEDSNYEDSEYGQLYKYTTKDRFGNEVSSGVATYEPLIGNDENPWRQPVFYSERNILAPDNDYYQEEPYGESFFPAASVGYSRVEVRSISSEVANLDKHGTGKVVHEFYTAKDFPVKLNRTTVERKVYHPSRYFPNPLKITTHDLLAVSQGFVIELNDMHGKEKGQYVYAQGKENPDEFISGIQYKYKHNGDKLENEVMVMNANGAVENNLVGLEYDVAVDMNEHRSVRRNAEGDAQADNFLLGLFFVVPTFWPKYQQEEVAFKSASVTKVINRFGLLEEVVAYDLGSNVVTKNKLWDAETGSVLLTETKNNFDDNIYAFNYPAHWAYNRMGGAYQNAGYVIGLPSGSHIDDPAYAAYFTEGDELLVNGTSRLWVTGINPFRIVNAAGTIISNSSVGSFRVIRSGRRNQLTASVGQMVSLRNPLVWNSGTGKFELSVSAATEIINASAIEFGEKWKTVCKCGVEPADAYNPYLKGIRGNWRPVKPYVFLTGRQQTRQNNNVNIRKDGTYTSYVPYWTVPVGSSVEWVKNTNPGSGWQHSSEVSIYSPYGFELENKDALGRYSAAVYGYNNSLPKQVTANSKYYQTAFDGFEDYDFDTCRIEHFGLKKAIADMPDSDVDVKQTGSPYQKYSHTGRRSVRVEPGKKVEINKEVNPCTTGGGGLEGGGDGH